MSSMTAILVSVLFLASVAGLTYALMLGTKKDADRWLVDRRVTDRRNQADSAPVQVPERRTSERRAPEDVGPGE